MKLRTPAIAASALGAGLLLAVAVPLSASAHIEITPDSTAAGSYSDLTFSVPHGCDGSPTTKIAIDIPESVVSVTPTVNPNWTIEKVSVKLAKPIADSEGNSITERVGQVVYTATTPLAPDERDTFTLSVPLPEDAAGKTLEFPVTQTCEAGSTEWNQKTPAGGEEPEHPAPAITVTAATAEGHDHAAETVSTTDAAASTAQAGPDVLARVLGVAGLIVGVVGIVIAVVSRRRGSRA